MALEGWLAFLAECLTSVVYRFQVWTYWDRSMKVR